MVTEFRIWKFDTMFETYEKEVLSKIPLRVMKGLIRDEVTILWSDFIAYYWHDTVDKELERWFRECIKNYTVKAVQTYDDQLDLAFDVGASKIEEIANEYGVSARELAQEISKYVKDEWD